MTNKSDYIIRTLNLSQHPEGGYYKETYRSLGAIEEKNLGPNFKGKRNYATCIYFLLTSNKFSALHRIKQDEIWHFYDGAPLNLHTISVHGEHKMIRIGRDLAKGETPQFVVPGGCWFGAEVADKDAYSLVGCTVSPGFSFDDFELKSREDLCALFPDKKEIISKLTNH